MIAPFQAKQKAPRLCAEGLEKSKYGIRRWGLQEIELVALKVDAVGAKGQSASHSPAESVEALLVCKGVKGGNRVVAGFLCFRSVGGFFVFESSSAQGFGGNFGVFFGHFLFL
jgi:hypothetical protein